MKKTVSISLASTPFVIEEDAYQTLDRYLSSVKAHFANITDASEVVADIEGRIAEQFLDSGKKIITQQEVDSVIASMGDVHEFGGSTSDEKSEAKKKRLYRNPDDVVVAGVASGIAAYIGVDVVWIRLAFILFTLTHGFGILIYIAFWLAMPEAKSASQRLEMSGTPVTLETLSERIKERVDEVKKQDRSFWGRLFTLPFTIIGGAIRFIVTKIFPFIGRIIGVVVALVSTVGLFALSVGFGLLVLHRGGEYIDFPLQAVLSTGAILLAAVSVYIALAIPVLLLLFLGSALIFNRRIISGSATLSLLGIWFIAIVVGAVSGFSIGAKVASYVATSPEYQEETQTLESVAPFSEISAHNGVRVKYAQSSAVSVSLAGRVKDLNHVAIVSNGGVLRIEPERRDGTRFCLFCDFEVPTVIVTAPSVTKFSGENATRFTGEGITSTTPISIQLSNGSRGVFDINAAELSATIKNAVYLELIGSARSAVLTGENGARVNASGFTADEATINVANASEAEIGVTKILNAQARNGAEIRYAGSPVLTEDARNGADIRRVDAE